MLSFEDNTLTVQILSTAAEDLKTLTANIKNVSNIHRLNVFWRPKAQFLAITPFEIKLDRKGNVPAIQIFITKLMIKLLTHDIFSAVETFSTDIAFHDLKFFNKEYEQFHQWYEFWWMTYMTKTRRQLKTLLLPYYEYIMFCQTSHVMFRTPKDPPALTLSYIQYPRITKLCTPARGTVMSPEFADMVENAGTSRRLSFSHSLSGVVILQPGIAEKFFIVYENVIVEHQVTTTCDHFTAHVIFIEDVRAFCNVDWNSVPWVLKMTTVDRGLFSKLHPANFEYLREKTEGEGSQYFLFHIKMFCYFFKRDRICYRIFSHLDGYLGHICTLSQTYRCHLKIAFYRHPWQLHHLTRILVSQPYITSIEIHAASRSEIRPCIRSKEKYDQQKIKI